MKKLNLFFSFLKICITTPGLVMKNIFHFTINIVCKNYVVKKYNLPKGLQTIDLLDLFPQFEETIYNYTYLDGTSRITDIALLKLLAKKYPDGRYMEFGTWRGESISNIAPLVREAYAASFSDEDMRKFGIPAHDIKASRFFTKGIAQINNIEHNTQTFDFTPYYKTCDMVFVDADHQYKGVSVDTRSAFKLLKNDSSIIVWHDYGLSYETPNWQVIRGILDGAPDDEARKNIYHISNTLCAVYIKGGFKAGYPEKSVPNKKFTLTIKATKL